MPVAKDCSLLVNVSLSGISLKITVLIAATCRQLLNIVRARVYPDILIGISSAWNFRINASMSFCVKYLNPFDGTDCDSWSDLSRQVSAFIVWMTVKFSAGTCQLSHAVSGMSCLHALPNLQASRITRNTAHLNGFAVFCFSLPTTCC